MLVKGEWIKSVDVKTNSKGKEYMLVHTAKKNYWVAKEDTKTWDAIDKSKDWKGLVFEEKDGRLRVINRDIKEMHDTIAEIIWQLEVIKLGLGYMLTEHALKSENSEEKQQQ